MPTIEQLSEQATEVINNWEIRVLVVISFLLQVILILFSNRRRVDARIWIRILFADWVATVALGILARSQIHHSGKSTGKPSDVIQAFWAAFLILHLGGPDNISAYTTQDNELWLRHLLGLVIEFGVAFYVFVRSCWSGAVLSFLAIPVLIPGIIKYGQKTYALQFVASRNVKGMDRRLHPNTLVGPHWNKEDSRNPFQMAGQLFYRSMFLFQNAAVSFSDLEDTRSIISKVSREEAFRLIEIELNFIYDTIYTKALHIYTPLGYFLRFICISSTGVALIIFCVSIDKKAYPAADIAITYLLLVGAIFLEVVGLIHLIFSEWTVIRFDTDRNGSPKKKGIVSFIYSIVSKRKWSGSMGQHNLISSYLKRENYQLWKLLKLFRVDQMLKQFYTNWTDVGEKTKDVIFQQIHDKGEEIARSPLDKNLRQALVARRGDGVLEKYSLLDLRWSTIGLEFSRSLLVWHIATDLCYYDDEDDGKLLHHCIPQVKISKHLSDYMFFLLVLKPNMLPSDATMMSAGHHDLPNEEAYKELKAYRFEGTEKNVCWEIYHGYISSLATTGEPSLETTGEPSLAPTGATGEPSLATTGERWNLVDGYTLATELQKLEFNKKWGLISEVWVEMLAYAASHCTWEEHAHQIRRGGELLTHVSLLMAHVGLSLHYQNLQPLIPGPYSRDAVLRKIHANVKAITRDAVLRKILANV